MCKLVFGANMETKALTTQGPDSSIAHRALIVETTITMTNTIPNGHLSRVKILLEWSWTSIHHLIKLWLKTLWTWMVNTSLTSKSPTDSIRMGRSDSNKTSAEQMRARSCHPRILTTWSEFTLSSMLPASIQHLKRLHSESTRTTVCTIRSWTIKIWLKVLNTTSIEENMLMSLAVRSWLFKCSLQLKSTLKSSVANSMPINKLLTLFSVSRRTTTSTT